jgi:hypothetical protein
VGTPKYIQYPPSQAQNEEMVKRKKGCGCSNPSSSHYLAVKLVKPTSDLSLSLSLLVVVFASFLLSLSLLL